MDKIRFEFVFTTLTVAATFSGIVVAWIYNHYKSKRPIDDSKADQHCAEVEKKHDALAEKYHQQQRYLNERSTLLDKRFELIEWEVKTFKERIEANEERSKVNRRMIKKIIDRYINKTY